MPLPRPKPRTLAVVAALVAVVGGLWWHSRSRRLEVEHRAGAVASEIAGRPVRVRCPGPIRRRFMYEIVDGSVRFDADGRPVDDTRLAAPVCDGLRRLLDDGASLDLDCLRAGACPERLEQVARGLAVLTHEAVHLRGVADEGLTECEARRRVTRTAEELGLDARDAQSVATWQATIWAARLPERYRTCAGGGS